MGIQLAIASKKPEEMNEEELAAYKKWNEWHEANKERFAREAAEREERKRIERERREERDRRAAEYRRKMAEEDRRLNENKGTLGWFMQQVQSTRPVIMPLRLTCSQDDAAKFLQVAYRAEVERRNMQVAFDTCTSAAINAVSRWLTSHTKPGLILRGYIGVGKTTMMWAIRSILKHLLERELKIVDARRIADMGKRDNSEFEEYTKCLCLGIDDLGTEPITVKNYGNEVTPLVELLSERYNNQRFTIITTNLTTKKDESGAEVDELQQVYGDRTFDRLKEMCNFMSYSGNQQSYRK
jgi:DNA replication protein DnaC